MDTNQRWRLFLALVILGFLIAPGAGAPVIQTSLQDENGFFEGNYLIIQGNSLQAQSSPTIVFPQTLGCMTGTPEGIDNLLDEIIRRESGGDPKTCNKQYGCSAGMGLAGFIPSTWNETIARMSCSGKYSTEKCVKAYLPDRCNQKVYLPVSLERLDAVFDGECNRIVARWLLLEDGISHWDEWSGPYILASYGLEEN